MTEFLRLQGRPLFELDESTPERGEVRAGAGTTMREVASVFSGQLTNEIKPIVETLIRNLQDTGTHEVELTFGLKVTADFGLVVAKAGTSGHFEVKLKWNRDGDGARA